MGFEYIYAYHENLKYGFYVCCAIGIAWLAVGLILRMTNEMDKDDWFLFMGVGFLWFLIFFVLTLSPGIEHIKQVRDNLQTTQRENSNENSPGLSDDARNAFGLCRTNR